MIYAKNESTYFTLDTGSSETQIGLNETHMINEWPQLGTMQRAKALLFTSFAINE